MPKTLLVEHATVYRYRSSVAFGEHRMMLRPRDSHDLRLVTTELDISPPADLRWLHDAFGNSIAIARFSQPADELRIVSRLTLERFGLAKPVFELASAAQLYPFAYTPDERLDLGALLVRGYADPDSVLAQWTQGFVAANPTGTLALLADINVGIKAQFTYVARDEEGTQTPQQTLARRSGTCRDFALLMIEAARCLGLAARFVSGYLHVPALDPAQSGLRGAGATHAWANIYLPGAGWVEYDPTNGIIGSEALIRVAVTRDPSQAVPISGSFSGRPGDYLGMSAQVVVSSGGS